MDKRAAARIAPVAEDPARSGRLPHLGLRPEEPVPPVFFLPGDPERVGLFAAQAQRFRLLSENREFRVAVGERGGLPFGVCSTGIGGGSAEIAVVELARLGVRLLVRTGGCGALQEDVPCGSLVVVHAAVRFGGSSSFYVPAEFPAAGDSFVAAALVGSCRRLGCVHRWGIGATVDSYYEGQGRPSLAWRQPSRGAELLARMREAGVLCCDMETETVLTLSLLFGIRAGSILAVHGNRATGQWLLDYQEAQEQLVRAALEALPELSGLAPAAASAGP